MTLAPGIWKDVNFISFIKIVEFIEFSGSFDNRQQ